MFKTGLALKRVLAHEPDHWILTRWQIELFYQELKSTLGFAQYRFPYDGAVRAWAEITLTTILFLEHELAQHLSDRRKW